MSPTDDVELIADFTPDPIRQIASVDTLRAISDPTRMRLAEVMVTRQEPAWSVKELAAALGVPQTRLYHHVEQLLAHDIIRAVERRVVSGIIETRYRVAALSFQIDRRLFSGDTDDATAAIRDTLATVFDAARDEVEAAMRSGAIDPSSHDGRHRATISRSLARLSQARAGELHRRLRELVDEFGNDEEPDGVPIGLVIAAYPVQLPIKEPSDG